MLHFAFALGCKVSAVGFYCLAYLRLAFSKYPFTCLSQSGPGRAIPFGHVPDMCIRLRAQRRAVVLDVHLRLVPLRASIAA